MRGSTLLAGIFSANPLLALARPPAAPVALSGSAWVDVDASGKAHVVEMGKLSPLSDVPGLAPVVQRIDDRLRAAIESWQFVPATRDGVATASPTHVAVSMEATDDGAGGMAVRLLSVGTGAGLRDMDMAPLVRAVTLSQTEGLVKLQLTYAADGSISSAELLESHEFRKGRFIGVANSVLRRKAVAAAASWRLAPETVDGIPRAGVGSITLVFCLTPQCVQAPRADGEGQASPQFASTDPAVRLRTPIAGTAL